MKRFRILSFDIDSMASLIDLNNPASWNFVVARYGIFNAQTKAQNLKDMGNAPFSILAFHNKFLHQIRDSFILGAYYPALTSACALGERILNHLALNLLESYKSSPHYKKLYGKKTFDNWELPINALRDWGVLLPEVAIAYDKLHVVRNRKAIHFNLETEVKDRDYALEAINLLSDIIGNQFTAFGNQPWFISNIPGASFIKKSFEESPFIKLVYRPNCAYVGTNHRIEIKEINGMNHVFPIDDTIYPEIEITDEVFAEIYNGRNK